MSIFHVLRFVVYNHTVRLIDIVCDIKHITIFFTTILKFSQPRNTRRENTGHLRTSSGYDGVSIYIHQI